ncbi:uncharacterized protein BDR25DRAFT_315885 [Lindgomyces ingoldianus]|uniref:Uncharacterized protein n=1 Tax=Lindgomyces ingoldianus TaxID=673940 RepID=A0ACB6QPP6_9PLEO|nr:uncharacterized protein BDR25DRAFT_315885 [Lindgomyces ingoldianus]KAF2468954.1 hypothetical protein BDR25DRAFT_315885 [Lindgomyces ingoldianus]
MRYLIVGPFAWFLVLACFLLFMFYLMIRCSSYLPKHSFWNSTWRNELDFAGRVCHSLTTLCILVVLGICVVCRHSARWRFGPNPGSILTAVLPLVAWACMLGGLAVVEGYGVWGQEQERATWFALGNTLGLMLLAACVVVEEIPALRVNVIGLWELVARRCGNWWWRVKQVVKPPATNT